MVFSSLEFIFLFLPAFLLLYGTASKKYKNSVIFAGSVFFYSMGFRGEGLESQLIKTSLFLLTVLFNFIIGEFIQNFRKAAKFWLVVGIIYNFSLLIFFKYKKTTQLPPWTFQPWTVVVLKKSMITYPVTVYGSYSPFLFFGSFYGFCRFFCFNSFNLFRLFGSFKSFLDGESYLLIFGINFHDLNINLLTNGKSIVNVVNASMSYLRNMDKTVCTGNYAYECAIGSKSEDSNLNNITYVELFSNTGPGIFLRKLHGKRNLLGFGIEVLNYNSYFLTHLNDISRLFSSTRPSELSRK